MNKIFYLLFIFHSASAVDIAITIDDYPLPDTEIFSLKKRTEHFIKACKSNNCKIAFFCVGDHCNSERNSSNYLKWLSENGHFLANHSMTHRHLSEIPLAEFETEIIQMDQILMPYEKGRKWFRYPFLDYGNRSAMGGTNEKALTALKILKKLDYKEGYVTINTFDWHINDRLLQAVKAKKKIDYEALKNLYLKLLNDWCHYYIAAYQKNFKEITHTLLLHANDLNGMYLADILQMIRKTGWNIVSPEVAFQDISWREKIFQNPKLISFAKPATLSCDEIDKLLSTIPGFDFIKL